MEKWKRLIKIDRESDLPLYSQIVQNLTDLIQAGELAAGENLPSENDFTKLYGVSRLTVRQALDKLEKNNLITRLHGIGTFVAKKVVTPITPSRLSFTEKMQKLGKTASSRLISFKETPATPEVASHLGIAEGDSVFKLVRVRLVDDAPTSLETAYLSVKRFSGLTLEKLGVGSLYELLHREYHMTVTVMEQTVEPVALNEQQAHLLETERDALGLLSKVTAFIRDGDPVEYSQAVIRGDKAVFVIRFREEEKLL
jgi:GntR family transcriptional regulator